MLPAVILRFMENDEWYYYDKGTGKYALTEKAPKDAVKSYDLLYWGLDNVYYRVEGVLNHMPPYIATAVQFWIVNPLVSKAILNPEFGYPLDEYDSEYDGVNVPRDVFLRIFRAAVKSGLYMPCALDDFKFTYYYGAHDSGHVLQNRLFHDEMVKRGWSQDDMMKFVDKRYTDPDDPRRYKWYYDIIKEVAARHHKEIIRIAKKANPNFSEIRNLSKVAMMNDEEFFAEAFTNSQLSKPNEIGKAMGVWLTEKGENFNYIQQADAQGEQFKVKDIDDELISALIRLRNESKRTE